MPAAPIECQHCSRQVVSQRPKQAKWCATCRVLRAIIATADFRPAACTICTKKFHPTDRAQRRCPECLKYTRNPEHVLQQPCKVCGAKDALGLAREDVAVCYDCLASTDKDKRRRVVRGAAARLDQLAAEPPRPPALRWHQGRAIV